MLLNQIANGEYGVGDQLPTEQTLGQMFDVSRVTVRLALKDLEREGLIERQRGRGTFLKELPSGDYRHRERRLIPLKTLLLDLSRRGGEVVRRGRARAPNVVTKELDLASDEDAAFFVKIYADPAGPKCGVKRYFRPAVLPFLDDDLVSEPDFDEALSKRVSGRIETSRFWVEAILVEPHMVLIFDIPVGSPLISIWWTTVVDGDVFSISQMLYPGNDVGLLIEPPSRSHTSDLG